jgi:ribosomal protein L7/L12
MNMTFFYSAIAIMLIIIAQDIVKKRYGFDMNNVDGKKLKKKVLAIVRFVKINLKGLKPINTSSVIRRTTGNSRLVLLDAGTNKATVMATLRQITGVDYSTAKQLVESTPSQIYENVSEKEAVLTKKALEFVGATLEVK